MRIVRRVWVILLLSVIANLGLNAAGENKADELILGKWKILFDERVGSDRKPFFMTYEFLKEGKVKVNKAVMDNLTKARG